MNITINLTITIGTAADGTQTVTIAPPAASAPEPVPTPPPVVAAPVTASGEPMRIPPPPADVAERMAQKMAIIRPEPRPLTVPPADHIAATGNMVEPVADVQYPPGEGPYGYYDDETDDAEGEPVIVDLFAMTQPVSNSYTLPVETPDDDVSEDALMRAMQAIQANRRLPRGTAKCVAILEERGWVTERDGRRVATSTGSIEVNRWSRKNRT